MIKIATLLSLLCATTCYGQEDIFEPDDVPVVKFSDVCVAKIARQDTRTVVSIQVPKFRPATRTETVDVTRHVAETRTRVRRIEGRDVQETFTVLVPIKTQVERAVTYFESDGFTVREANLASIEARTVSGELISTEDLEQRLQMPTHVMLLRAPWGDHPPIDDYYRSILRSDLVFLYLKPGDEQE